MPDLDADLDTVRGQILDAAGKRLAERPHARRRGWLAIVVLLLVFGGGTVAVAAGVFDDSSAKLVSHDLSAHRRAVACKRASSSDRPARPNDSCVHQSSRRLQPGCRANQRRRLLHGAPPRKSHNTTRKPASPARRTDPPRRPCWPPSPPTAAGKGSALPRPGQRPASSRSGVERYPYACATGTGSSGSRKGRTCPPATPLEQSRADTHPSDEHSPSAGERVRPGRRDEVAWRRGEGRARAHTSRSRRQLGAWRVLPLHRRRARGVGTRIGLRALGFSDWKVVSRSSGD